MSNKKPRKGAGRTAAKLKKGQTAKENGHEPCLQAMVWYRQEHYPELLTLFSDAALLPPTYSAWLSRAEAKKAEVEAAGDQVIKVYIEPEYFGQWCREKNLPTDAESRTRLAIEVAQMQTFTL
ncbi:MAG: hypothetical protein V2I32_12085 [Desulforhopalus sp.]|jgi:hypothetical protein|nr:hypothetical protein [Desulforhopalus sp.]